MEKVKILTVGAGAVGAYFTGRLAQAGAEVSVVVRSDYDAVKANGFEIISELGISISNLTVFTVPPMNIPIRRTMYS